MTRSTYLYLLLGLLLLTIALAVLLPRFRREKAPGGQGLYSVDRTNYFPSPSGDGPCRTRFYPTDPIGVGRACPGDREIRRRETVRREERSCQPRNTKSEPTSCCPDRRRGSCA